MRAWSIEDNQLTSNEYQIPLDLKDGHFFSTGIHDRLYFSRYDYPT